MGLTRAFFFAGTPTLVSSLWNVDDAATEKLMSAFYRNWQAGMGKAQALQVAQAEVRANPKWASPFFWAAFVLNGDAGEVSQPPVPPPTETASSEAPAPAATETTSSEPPEEDGSFSWLIAVIVGVLGVGVLVLVYVRRRMQHESNG